MKLISGEFLDGPLPFRSDLVTCHWHEHCPALGWESHPRSMADFMKNGMPIVKIARNWNLDPSFMKKNKFWWVKSRCLLKACFMVKWHLVCMFDQIMTENDKLRLVKSTQIPWKSPNLHLIFYQCCPPYIPLGHPAIWPAIWLAGGFALWSSRALGGMDKWKT